MEESDDDLENVTVSMPEAMVDDIDSRLTYGDSRSAWVREAIRQRLTRGDVADEQPAD